MDKKKLSNATNDGLKKQVSELNSNKTKFKFKSVNVGGDKDRIGM